MEYGVRESDAAKKQRLHCICGDVCVGSDLSTAIKHECRVLKKLPQSHGADTSTRVTAFQTGTKGLYDLIWLIIDIFLIYVRFVFLCSSQKSYSVIDTKGKWTAISLDPKTHSELPRTCALQSKFFLHLRILHYMFRFSECLYMYVSSSIFRSDCVSPAYSTRTKKFPTAERDKFVHSGTQRTAHFADHATAPTG